MKDLINNNRAEIELWNLIRPGTTDYDFDNAINIKEWEFGFFFEIKSNVDGKSYVAKRLNFQVGGKLN